MNRKLRDAFLEKITSARREEDKTDFRRARVYLERAHVLSQAYAGSTSECTDACSRSHAAGAISAKS